MLSQAEWEELDGLLGAPRQYDQDAALRCAERVNALLRAASVAYSVEPRTTVVTEATRRVGEPYPTEGVERWVLDHEVVPVDEALQASGHEATRTPAIHASAQSLRNLRRAIADATGSQA